MTCTEERIIYLQEDYIPSLEALVTKRNETICELHIKINDLKTVSKNKDVTISKLENDIVNINKLLVEFRKELNAIEESNLSLKRALEHYKSVIFNLENKKIKTIELLDSIIMEISQP